jgi:hypothetical protein
MKPFTIRSSPFGATSSITSFPIPPKSHDHEAERCIGSEPGNHILERSIFSSSEL